MDYDFLKEKMIKQQIEARGVNDKRVIAAVRAVPRHEFVPEEDMDYAYDDAPLPVGCGQTISQPYIVALMTEMLKIKQDSRVLEIGTGSGYQTAVLSRMAKEVYTVEIVETLSSRAKDTIENLKITNVHFKAGDGSSGWPEFAPYNRIIITAAAPDIPAELESQLDTNGGIIIAPVGNMLVQRLVKIKYVKLKKEVTYGINVVFVPMHGQYGFK
jgi:protein-L-isoaspartate(D-aspartate) O-methyltransferase